MVRIAGDGDLRKLIWQVAEFSGVRIVTRAIMDNYFHVLTEVARERAVSDCRGQSETGLILPI